MNIRELNSREAIRRYLNSLEERGQTAIALDLEGEFNLHCYGEHLCLIQIYDGRESLIVDPVRLTSPDDYREIFEKRGLMKIMYDSASDGSLLKNECGIDLKSVLDLRPAVSLLEFQKQGLSSVLEETLGLPPVNKKRFQMYNWMKRPLDPGAMEYAMGDVIHLFELKEELFRRLREKDLFDQYLLQNLMVQNGEIKSNKTDRHLKAKGYRRLKPRQQKLFKEVFELRDAWARKVNRPPDYVFRNQELLRLCQEDIRDPEFIRKNINARLDSRSREELLARMTETVENPPR